MRGKINITLFERLESIQLIMYAHSGQRRGPCEPVIPTPGLRKSIDKASWV